MKKVYTIVLGIALLLLLASPAFAATMTEPFTLTQTVQGGQISGTQTKDVPVYYSVSGETYYIKIPGEITFDGQNDFIETEVNVTKVTLAGDRYVEVKVNSTHGWELMQHDSGGNLIPDEAGITYIMEKYSPSTSTWSKISTENTNFISLIQVHGASDDMCVKLKFTMIDNPPNTGYYKDTMTFISEVMNPSA